MKPQFLLVKVHRVTRVTEKQTVFNEHNARRLELESWVVDEQLMREDKQIQCLLSNEVGRKRALAALKSIRRSNFF